MAERRKERRYPQLVGRRARSLLVVLALEVGGKSSPTTQHFISALARARARCEGLLLRRRAEQAWRFLGALLSCTAARAVADTLEFPGSVGADGATPHMRLSETSRLRGWRFEAVTCSQWRIAPKPFDTYSFASKKHAAHVNVRITSLEPAHVQVVHQGEHGVREVQEARHTRRVPGPSPNLDAWWEVLDDVNLEEVFNTRFPVSQSCPFMRG